MSLLSLALEEQGVFAPPEPAQDFDKSVAQFLESACWLHGLSSALIKVNREANNSCKLTQEGIVITLNPSSIEGLSIMKDSEGVPLFSLETASHLMAMHEVCRACDFLDPSFFIELQEPASCPPFARKFFVAYIDALCADMRMRKIPFIERHFFAYAPLTIDHTMTGLPSHVQLLNLLRFYLLEEAGDLPAHEDVLALLGRRSEDNAVVKQLREAFGDYHLAYDKRHALANGILFEAYLELAKKEYVKRSAYDIQKTYQRFPVFKGLEESTREAVALLGDTKIKERTEDLLELVEADEEGLKQKSPKDEVPEGETEDTSVLPSASSLGSTITLSDSLLPDYDNRARKLAPLISQIAATLIRLSTSTEDITIPRYKCSRAFEGPRLNPHALIEASLQLKLGNAMPIWQPIEKRIRYQEQHFAGLDVYLLLDVSCSMAGKNAEAAVDMGICLMEGVQLARHRASLEAKKGPVFVRTQILAFGAGFKALTPLVSSLPYSQKAMACYNLMHPESDQTSVGQALRYLRYSASQWQNRQALCLIVSDGMFSDSIPALRVAKKMPPNVHIGQIKIGEQTGIPITSQYEIVSDPQVLPQKILSILETLFKKLDH